RPNASTECNRNSLTTRGKRKRASLRVWRYTLSDEFPTSHHMRTGAWVSDGRTSLRVCLVGVRTDAAFDESIENLWSGRVHTANETGGIPMFLQRSEAAKAFQLVREPTRNNVATVFWATGTIDGKPQTIKIPVDSVTKRITFTFSMDTKGNELKLTQPSGRAITEGSASTEVTELNCGRILTVSSPEAGEWNGEITGTGRYWVEVQAQSDIYFLGVEFVKKGGRPGHGGLFRIEGQPVAGTPATLQ